MKKQNLILFSFILILAAGCKTKQVISSTKSNEKPLVELIEKVQNAEPTFKTVNVNKMNLALTMNERKLNVNASCKIIFDSAIHVSIQPILGIELFKAEISKDSIQIFDKMNRRYYALGYAYFESKFGINIDYFSLQALITNRLFKLGKNDDLVLDCLLGKSEIGNQTIEFENTKIKQQTSISDAFRIEQVKINAKKTTAVFETDYSTFINFDSIVFPQKINILVTNQKNKFNCVFLISKAVFNTNLQITPTEIYRFEKREVDQLFRK